MCQYTHDAGSPHRLRWCEPLGWHCNHACQVSVIGNGRSDIRRAALSCHVMSWHVMGHDMSCTKIGLEACAQNQSMQQCMNLFCVHGLKPTLVHRNLKNPVFLDNVCQFSIRLKKLTHVIKVNRFRRVRGGREARGHQLETQFVCKNRGFMHGDPYLP